MSQASEAYILGALDLDQNAKDELVNLCAKGNRRMSDEDIKLPGILENLSGPIITRHGKVGPTPGSLWLDKYQASQFGWLEITVL